MNFKETFNNYVLTFDHNNEGVVLKHAHSFRVSKYAKEIAESLNLDSKQVYLAELIGLLHDIGRFEQAVKHHTFDDLKSFDHGDYGAHLLFEENKIKDYHLDEGDYSVIKKAIINHNKFYIEDNLTKEEELMAKIIRDADKLDIFYLTVTNQIKFDIDNDDLSPKVLESFRKYETVDNKDIVNKPDKIISMIALIFDLNYEYSLKIVRDKYIDTLMIKYEIDDDLQDIVNNFIKEGFYVRNQIQS
jgi:putative nucleotidyltransferase with HDIG domain